MSDAESGWRHVKIEKTGRVAVVRYDRGDGINALSLRGMRELTEAAEWIRADHDIYAVALVGSSNGFSAGRDLKDPEMDARRNAPLLHRRYAAGSGARLCKAWEEIEQFTVCGIEGFAIGGGLALAVALDYRIIGESTHMRAPEAALGLSMSWGSVPRLVNLIGPARTKQILIHANHRISGTDALNWGLVQEIVSDGDAEAAAVKAAEKAADIPPVAARMIKRAVNAYANALADAVVHMDTDQVLLAESGHDHLEAVDAFLAKRDPTFTGA
jgi:enoyl-CoA hydratase/carnithine racemase